MKVQFEVFKPCWLLNWDLNKNAIKKTNKKPININPMNNNLPLDCLLVIHEYEYITRNVWIPAIKDMMNIIEFW